MVERVDVTIIGGGPAGAAASIILKKRHPDKTVLLVEASHYENWRVGETLSPDAGKAFRELDIWDSFQKNEPLPTLGTCAAWESEEIHENEFLFHPEGKGWHLNRVQFDQWMADEAVKKGATLLTDTRYVRHQRSSDQQFKLTLQNKAGEFQVETNLVIDASGRSSGFLKHSQGKKQAYDRLSGSIGFFKADSSPSEISTYTLVEAMEDGWWYSAVLPDQQVVVAYMTDADILKKKNLKEISSFCGMLEQTKYTKLRVENDVPLKPLAILSAASLMSDPVCGNGWLAVGDAVSTFDPLSSQGIYKAIRSGMFGAYAISDFFNGDDSGFAKYERFIKEEYNEYLSTRSQFYNMVKRWPESEFWLRRQGH